MQVLLRRRYDLQQGGRGHQPKRLLRLILTISWELHRRLLRLRKASRRQRLRRIKMIWTAIAISAAICEACGAYDVTKTEQGLKKGVAVEAFTFLVGSKPRAVALYLRDQLLLAGCVAPAIILALLHNVPLAYGCSIGPLVYGLKHI